MSETVLPSASDWDVRHLPNMPRFLTELIAQASVQLDVDKIVVFGSRARCDHRPTSDYDLCFFLRSPRNWSKYVIDATDSASTLCRLDLLSFTELDQKLAQEILDHGVVLYDIKETRSVP